MKPIVTRKQSRFAACFGRGEHEDPQHRTRREGGDVRRLPIRRDDTLQFSPELIHRIEFGSLLRQPHELDVELRRQSLGLAIGVRGRAIGEQPNRVWAAVVSRSSSRKARASAPPAFARARTTRCPVRALIAPNSTALAFSPVITTVPADPTGAHAARSGGKSRNNLQSVKSMTSCGPTAALRRRRRAPFSAPDASRVHCSDSAGASTGSPSRATGGAACAG